MGGKMNPAPFSELFERSPCILGEGAFIERLRSNRDYELDPRIVNSAFLMAGGEGSFREHFVLQRILAFSSMKPLTHAPGQEV
jgi:hypothetical protein